MEKSKRWFGFQVINDGSSIQNLEHLKINIRLLYKLREMEQLCACAFKLNSIFPVNHNWFEAGWNSYVVQVL